MMHSKIAIIITAAGSSTRIGGNVKKEYLPYKDGTVLSNCAIAFLKADYSFCSLCNEIEVDNHSVSNNVYCKISNFIITCPAGGKSEAEKALEKDKELSELLNNEHKNIKINFVEGGNTRQKSVFNALKAIKSSGINPDIVLIHDGARPFIKEDVIRNVTAGALEFGASVPGVTPIDTQKEIDENGFVVRHLIRKNLLAVQTPQGFNFAKLYEAHKNAEIDYSDKNCMEVREFTDDTEIWGKYYGLVKTVPGDINNIKITYPSDLERL